MPKVLLFGGSGLVGSRIFQLLGKDFELIAPIHKEVDLTDEEQIKKSIDYTKPSQIVYAAGFTNVDEAETNSDLTFLINSKAISTICKRAEGSKIPVYYLSTDYVFNGNKLDSPYTEEDEPDPLSVYAKSKREGEINNLSSSNKNCVIRLIMPYSGVYKKKLDLARSVLDKLKNNEKVFGVIDQNVNPVFVDDLVYGIGKLLQSYRSGIYHLGAGSFTTPFEFVSLIAKKFDLRKDLISPLKFEEFSKTRRAKRPKHSWLDISKFVKEFGEDILHPVEEGIELFKNQIQS